MLYPHVWTYTHCSHVHMLRTQFDLFLCDVRDRKQIVVLASGSLGMKLSDHFPLKLLLKWDAHVARIPTWRLQPVVLLDAPWRDSAQETGKLALDGLA
ncbi:hypothetical protein NDU88_001857 [Pleurodeles waltl]|uniref:Uncharacterized protein n=1 Tax=Pleurodeles waltl TaxID=8319 RepID=A0AAV7V9L5_PLEWA|nr:hypothetical protein NDU88_001857 [Pleurodeles waltl]